MTSRFVHPLSQEERREAFRKQWAAEAERPQSTRFNPYPGLRSFNTDERPIFKARSRQIEALEMAVALPQGERGAARHVVMVIGGSSSGKSSIVKAGLLAGLHDLELPGRPGNWYIAECRPVKAPMQELLQGLAVMLVDAVMKEVLALRDAAGPAAEAHARRIRDAVAAVIPGDGAPGGDPLALDRAEMVAQAKDNLASRLWDAPQRGDLKAMVLAFSRFVHVTLDAFDQALYPDRADPRDRPRLLLSIDQFEEIFRSNASGEGLNKEDASSEEQAVFELIRAVDRADQGLGKVAGPMGDGDDCKLLIVASMRSEEAHRCSQEPGLADVFNRAVHLVQLVQPEDAEAAIVEPAQLTLIRNGFPYAGEPAYPFTEGAVAAILQAYKIASSTIDHRADALSLLQHFLRLLWHDSLDAWVRGSREQPLVIDEAALSRIPGWDDPAPGDRAQWPSGETAARQHPLARVLNRRASEVLDRAIAAWVRTAGSGAAGRPVEQQARSVLQAALVSLVRFDDNRRVVRDWRTLDDMLEASMAAAETWAAGATAAEFEARFKAPLRKALEIFEQATLIERRADADTARPGRYAVYHESLIRNWTPYNEWVGDAAKAVAALHAIEGELNRTRMGGKAARPEDVVLIGQEGDLRAVIGPVEGLEPRVAETVDELYSSDKRMPWASQAWTRAEMTRADIGGAGTSGRMRAADLGSFNDIRRQAITTRYEQATKAEREAARAEGEAKRAAEERAAREQAEREKAEEAKRAAEERTARERAEKERAEAEANSLRVQQQSAKKMFWAGMFALAAAVVGVSGGVLYVYGRSVTQLTETKYKANKIGRIGSESSEINFGRKPNNDRDAWLALFALEKNKPVDWSAASNEPQATIERDLALHKTVHRMRLALNDAVYSISANTLPSAETAPVASPSVKCMSGRSEPLIIEDEKVEENSNSASRPRKVIYALDRGQLLYGIEGRFDWYVVPSQIPFDDNTVVCASLDATALLVRSRFYDKDAVYIVLTHWNRWRDRNGNWFWSLQPYQRYLSTKESDDLVVGNPIGVLTDQTVEHVREDGIVGFRVPIKDKADRTGFLWTNEGFSTWTPVPGVSKETPPPGVCEKDKRDGNRLRCKVVAESKGMPKVTATYFRPDDRDGKASDAKDQRCAEEAGKNQSPEFCNVRFQFTLHGETMRMAYQGRPPVKMDADAGEIRMTGDDGIVRRLKRDPEAFRSLLVRRIQAVPEQARKTCTERDGSVAAKDIEGFYPKKKDMPEMPDVLRSACARDDEEGLLQ